MIKKICSIAVSCTMVFQVFASSLSVKATTTIETIGTIYYVSTLDGNDRNDGLSEGKAFYSLQKINEIELKPGDKVLLEANSVFTDGFLHIKGSGSESAPIEINKYGEGSNPRIDTNGQGLWYQDYGKSLDSSSHKIKGYVSSSILLYDVEYINIKNLEITNKPLEIDSRYNYKDAMNRTGVAAVAQNKGTIDHIYLDGLNIHDVMGNVYDKHMNNGGIYFTAFLPKNELATGISKYNDVKIENCIVDNVNRWGIAVGYTAYWDRFTSAEISNEIAAKYGSTRVEIRNNYVKDAGGDAITTMYCDKPIIEYNVSDGAARQINTTDYSEVTSGRVAAAIWPWKCKTPVFQYNEAFDTYVNQDGQAWDADYGDGTIYQYNYSHNNGGGAIMICGAQAINTIFRYNISEDDLGGALNIPGNPTAHIYNNTFYMKEGIPFIRTGMTGGAAVVENNIIYNSGAAKAEDWTKSNSRVTYSNNLYYNYTNLPVDDMAAVTRNPEFINGGNGPAVYTGKTPSSESKIINELSAFDGYKLKDNSPAINAGKIIENNGGVDFFGNKIVGTPDIGAYESRIAMANTDNRLIDTIYMVKEANKKLYIPSLDKNPTSIEEVKAGLSIPSTATIKVLNGTTEVKDGNISNGMILKIIAESGAENAYVIEVKNDYQWALDYIGRQGKVWFAQKKANGIYSNLTVYDAQYPQWNGNNYGGVGIDAPNQSTIPTDTTHGLLVDTLGTVGREDGYSMVYRAPKTGTIILSVKDDEPYLRQSINSGGKVKVSFTHNGVEISAYELVTSKVKVDVTPMEIKVEKGDLIRIEARNIDNPTKPSIHITPKIQYQNKLIIEVNKVELNQLITDSTSLQQDSYTTESWNLFKSALDSAKLVVTNESAMQTEVDDSKATLENAKNALVERGNKTGLQASINNRPVLEQDKYTVDSWNGYKVALDEAIVVNDNIDAIQSQIDAAKSKLDNVFNALEEVTEIIVSKVSELKSVVSTNSVKLTWKSPQYIAGLKEYVVYKDGKKFATVDAKELIYDVVSLRANTIYGFKVISVYINGLESKPVSVNIRTISTTAAL